MRSAKSVMTLEKASGSDVYFSCSSMAFPCRVVIRLDRRRWDGLSVLDCSKCEKSRDRGQPEDQRGLAAGEVGRCFAQLFDGLILKAVGIGIHIVRQPAHQIGQHWAFSFHVMSGQSHGTCKTARGIRAGTELLIEQSHNAVRQ